MSGVSERRLSERLGVARDLLRRLRQEHLKEGEDWHMEGGEVTLRTPAAKELALLASGDVKKSAQDAPGSTGEPTRHGLGHQVAIAVRETATVTEGRSLEEVLTAVRPTPNRMIVLCRTDRGEAVRMLVRDNRHFIEGMKCPARHREEDLWELVGRCPRSRGRW